MQLAQYVEIGFAKLMRIVKPALRIALRLNPSLEVVNLVKLLATHSAVCHQTKVSNVVSRGFPQFVYLEREAMPQAGVRSLAYLAAALALTAAMHRRLFLYVEMEFANLMKTVQPVPRIALRLNPSREVASLAKFWEL